MNATDNLPASEWADANGIKQRFGIGRATLYSLMAEGRIRSTSLRLPGKLRGKRLFDIASIRSLIESGTSAPASPSGKGGNE